MDEENIMAMSEMQCIVYGNDQDYDKPVISECDIEQTAQVQSLLRLMKISNEFAAIKDSMEIAPLPGNRMESQTADTLTFGPQSKDFGQGLRATDILMSLSLSEETTRKKIKELTENAMNEVTKLFTEGDPLWQHDTDRGIEVLNNAEYTKRFSSNLDSTLDEIIRIIAVDAPLDLPVIDGTANNDLDPPRTGPSHSRQATREIGYIQMPAICVVEILMDVRLWSFVFSEMLSRATVLGNLSPGASGTQDGALQLMIAEYHAPSTLISTRQSCFARYCKDCSRNTWVIVDISLESMIDHPLMNCKRKPSGCLIQGLSDGNTQITWIEHTEAEIESNNPLFNSAVKSGIVFSAKHWVDKLARQCQSINLVIQQNLRGLQNEVSPFNKDGLLRLAHRMRREFHGAISATKENKYKPLPFKGGDGILIKTICGEAQKPTLITVTASSCLPFAHKKVFEFLGNVKNRVKWDVLALEHASEEVFNFHSSEGQEDIGSIIKMVDEKGDVDTLFLQDKHDNAVASYIIFSPITHHSIVSLSNQGNIHEVPLLPSGFAILSEKSPTRQEESKGSILTLSFQLLDSSSKKREISKKTVRKLYHLVTDTISNIRIALFEPPTDANHESTTM